jgi:hypothetical protein
MPQLLEKIMIYLIFPGLIASSLFIIFAQSILLPAGLEETILALIIIGVSTLPWYFIFCIMRAIFNKVRGKV